MGPLPECLNRRYEALDELMNELGSTVPDNGAEDVDASTDDPGIKLMCKFWNILKEDPECDLRQAVLKRMEVNTRGSGTIFRPQEISCYMASKDEKRKDALNKIQNLSPPSHTCRKVYGPDSGPVCCGSLNKSSVDGNEAIPLSRVLCNLKEAASFDKKCSKKITDLTAVQKQLLEQIQILEQREKEGVKLLKQADCMWTCMEDSYKQKIQESLDRQRTLLDEVMFSLKQKDVEHSSAKWRRNKKDLEFQLKSLGKCQQEIKEKLNQKNNDIKCMDAEIADLKKRIASNATDTETAKKSLAGKNTLSYNKMTALAAELKTLQQKVDKEKSLKKQKEDAGKQYIKEAREDLQKICRCLLQKKLENEDLKAERDAIIDEIELLKKSTDQCKDRCKNKQLAINEELEKVKNEIAMFRVKCTQCHVCVDTEDVRRFCTDCPKCLEQRDCIYGPDGKQCTEDPTNDCICMSIKRKFLDNVFENMYSVLAKQVKTNPGQALAEQIFECLKKSRNGKLTGPIRQSIQEFVLATVKRNLNLTIIGGAVKTRCEMDPESYKQLMNCLKKLTVTVPEKADKGTAAKKDACKRWGVGECNCPRGPKDCVCARKAPPPPHDPSPCGPQLEEDKTDIGKAKICPGHADTECGPDCANPKSSHPKIVDEMVKSYKSEPCGEQSCTFTKNMRAAQCVLGPEPLNSILPTTRYPTSVPFDPNLDEQLKCGCGCGMNRFCSCHGGDSVKSCKQRQETKISDTCDCHTALVAPKKKASENNEQNVSHSKQDKNKDTNSKTEDTMEINVLPAKNKHVPLVQAEVLSQAYQDRGTDPYVTLNKKYQERISLEQVVSNLTKQNVPRELFKVAFTDDSGQTEQEYTEMTTTSSGSIIMGLDEKTIEKIEESVEENSNMFIALKKTLSGHFIVEFNKNESNSSESQRVLVKRTGSGNMIMEVHKDLIKTIQPDVIKARENSFPQDSSMSVGLTKRNKDQKCNKNLCYTPKHDTRRSSIEQQKRDSDIPQHQFKIVTESMTSKKVLKGTRHYTGEMHAETKAQLSETSKKENDSIIEHVNVQFNPIITKSNDSNTEQLFIKKAFEEKIENNHTALEVTVLGENGAESNMKAEVLRTQSGHIAIDMKALEKEGKIANRLKEYPISLNKTDSKVLLNVGQNNKMPNAVWKRTSSGGMYAVIRNPVLKSPENKPDVLDTRQEVFKVRVKSVEHVDPEQTLVMKTTTSGNYVFVLDKEFERRYMQTVTEFIGDDSECFVNLSKTESECYTIDLNDNVDGDYNAILVKSSSGNIKVLVNSPTLKDMQKNLRPVQRSAKVFEGLLNKLPSSNKDIHRASEAKNKHLYTKSRSDSLLHNKVKIHDQICLLDEPTAILKKTESGKYAVILNKDSKVSFINNVKSFLSSSGQSMVPIKRTEQGDFIICLNCDHDGQYGSVKITPSGNIYVLIDEWVIKEMEKGSTKKTAEAATGGRSSASVHIIGSILHPHNKGVTTTCHAKPDSEGCDKQKCVCKELGTDVSYWGYRFTKQSSEGTNGSSDSSTCKICYPYLCKKDCVSRTPKRDSEEVCYSDESPKIGLSRCTHPELNTYPKKREQCYYVAETGYSLHTNRFDRFSNEFVDRVINKYNFKNDGANAGFNQKCGVSNLDYLDYLPPQLPPFLYGYNDDGTFYRVPC